LLTGNALMVHRGFKQPRLPLLLRRGLSYFQLGETRDIVARPGEDPAKG